MIHTDRLDRRGAYPKCLMRPHTRNIVNSLEFESAPEVSTGNSWKISNGRHIFSREIEHLLSYANAPGGKIVFIGPIFRRIVHVLMQPCVPDEMSIARHFIVNRRRITASFLRSVATYVVRVDRILLENLRERRKYYISA